MNQAIRNKLIENGVKNLKEFGYIHVTKETIMTDDVYKAFFKSMLEDGLGQGFDEEINSILEEIKS